MTFRAPKLCRVTDVRGIACGNVAVGRCTADVEWSVCAEHWQLVANNGFRPRTFEQIDAERAARQEARR